MKIKRDEFEFHDIKCIHPLVIMEKRNMSGKRIVVVTGGGSGIGRATAKRFGKDGDFVVVADIDEESARAVAAEITSAGGDAAHRVVDVARELEVGAFANAVEDEHGGADVLVTCAGLLQNVTSIRNLDIDEHDRSGPSTIGGSTSAAGTSAAA